MPRGAARTIVRRLGVSGLGVGLGVSGLDVSGLRVSGLGLLFGFAFLLCAFLNQFLVSDQLADHVLRAPVRFFPERAHDGLLFIRGERWESRMCPRDSGCNASRIRRVIRIDKCSIGPVM